MKLVAAKCPSCGASIEVNSKDETTKCKYCQQAILIEDAIAKYKLEISGEVEIKNLPKIDNYLKIANRHFKEKNYDDAYKNYNEVLTLDPDNTLALIRYAICKAYLNNSIDFKLEHLLNTFKNVVDLLKKQEKYDELINDYIDEVAKVVNDSKESTTKYYNSYSVVRTELADIQEKLYSCLSVYEELYENATDKKEDIAQKIISLIDDIIIDKSYKTGFDENGNRVNQVYKVSLSEKNRLTSLKMKYAGDEEVQVEKSNVVNKNPKINSKKLTAAQGWSIFLGLLVLGGLGNNEFVAVIPLILLIVLLNIDKSKIKIFQKYKSLNTILIIILIIAFCLLVS